MSGQSCGCSAGLEPGMCRPHERRYIVQPILGHYTSLWHASGQRAPASGLLQSGREVLHSNGSPPERLSVVFPCGDFEAFLRSPFRSTPGNGNMAIWDGWHAWSGH